MPRFYRDNSDFVAPPMYNLTGAGQPFGHSPIDLLLSGLALHFSDRLGGGTGTIQLWQDGAVIGPIVNSGAAQLFDDTAIVTVPAVTAANIDGASRFGVTLVAHPNSDAGLVTIEYAPANAADVGKEVFGIGSTFLTGHPGASSASGLYVSPPAYWAGWPGGWFDGSFSDVFQSPTPTSRPGNVADFEISDAGVQPFLSDGVASVPWCRSAVWDDFVLVLRAVPDGVYKFHLRVNQATVMTLETTASGSQRIWTPNSGTPVQLRAGDLTCWLIEWGAGAVAGLDGELLWTSRAQTESPVLGGGESGGQF